MEYPPTRIQAGPCLIRLLMWVHLDNGSSSLFSSGFCFLCLFLQPSYGSFPYIAFEPRLARDVSIAHNYIWNGLTLPPPPPTPPPLFTSFWSIYKILARVSILASCPQPVSIRSNPTHSNQNILMKSRLWSCHFMAWNLSNHLLSLFTSATTSTTHLLNEVISSHHGSIFWH